MRKSIERKILERMPIMSIINFPSKQLAKIFDLPPSTVSLIMSEKIKNRRVCASENVPMDNELDMVIEHHWMGSKEREYFINQLKKQI